MSYYTTLTEDVERAKVILTKEEPTPTCKDFRPDHNGECLNCDEWADAHDIFTAYRLLESFVEAIDAVGPKVCELAVRAEKRRVR